MYIIENKMCIYKYGYIYINNYNNIYIRINKYSLLYYNK